MIMNVNLQARKLLIKNDEIDPKCYCLNRIFCLSSKRIFYVDFDFQHFAITCQQTLDFSPFFSQKFFTLLPLMMACCRCCNGHRLFVKPTEKGQVVPENFEFICSKRFTDLDKLSLKSSFCYHPSCLKKSLYLQKSLKETRK